MNSTGDVVFASSRDGNAELYEQRHDGSVHRLTNNAHDDVRPRWSADGAHLAWLSDIDGRRRLMVWSPPDAPRVFVDDLVDQLQFSWSPRSDALAIVETGSTHLTLRSRSLDGTEVVVFDRHASAVEPVWSPSGDHLAWTSHDRDHTVIRWGERTGAVADGRVAIDGADCWLPRWLAVR